MRKTYRERGVREYWESRWDSVSVDVPMKNEEKYPLNCTLDLLQGSDLKKAVILEAGCGTGRILRYLHEKGFNVTGIDFVQIAISKINELNLGMKAEVGDITKLHFKEKTFSHVLAFGLYHNFELETMKDALHETNRVMKDHGLLCASFRADNIQNYMNDTLFSNGLGEKSSKKVAENQVFHKINLNEKEIKNIIKDSGFEIVKIYEMENMPILYKFEIFRHKSHKKFNENIARRDGYCLNLTGECIRRFLKKYFPKQFCNLYIVVAKKI